jgi:hypothetical protein
VADDLIPVTQGEPVGSCGLNQTDLALLGVHAEDIGQACAAQVASAFDGGLAEPVHRYVESLFTGRYDPADRELPNLSPAAYVKIHEVAVAAIIKAHRRTETQLYQTLMAYLRVSQADLTEMAKSAAADPARPRAVKSA